MLAASSLGFTLGILVTFIGIGIIVNGLVAYIVVQALGERAENRRRGGQGDTSV